MKPMNDSQHGNDAETARGAGVSPARLAGILPASGEAGLTSSSDQPHGAHNAGETPASQGFASYRLRDHRSAWLTILAGGFNAFFGSLSFGSSVLVLYFMKLELPLDKIGRLLSFFPFAGVVAVVLAPLTARFGFKRTFCLFYGIRKFVLLSTLATPAVMERFGVDVGVAYVTAVILLFALCRAIAETGYYPWSLGFVPGEVRGRYSAANNFVYSVVGLGAMVLASLSLQRSSGIGTFHWFIGGGAAVGFVGVVLHVFVPGGGPVRRTVRVGLYVRKMLAAFGHREFRRFLLSVGLLALSAGPMSFLPAYLKGGPFGLLDEHIVLVSMAGLVGNMAGSVVWGRVADRVGGRRTQILGLLMGCVFPMLWLVLPGGSLCLVAALVLALSGSVVGVGTAVGSSKHLFGQLVPPRRRAEFSAAWYASVGLCGGAGPLIAGHLLVALQGNPLTIGPAVVSPFVLLFLATTVLQLAAAGVLAGRK